MAHINSCEEKCTRATALFIPASPEQQIVEDAAAALNSRDRLMAARTLVLEGEGRQFNLGQDLRPGASGQTFSVSELRRQVEIPQRRVRTELTRTPNFPYFQGQQSQRQIQGVDGEIGYNVSPNGTATRIGPAAAEDRQADFFHHPVVLVEEVLSGRATLANLRQEGAERLADVTAGDQVQLVVAFNGNGLPTRIESKSYHPNLGDVVLSTHFADYQESDGIQVPTSVSTKVDDFTTAELRFAKSVVNAEIEDLAAPKAALGNASAAPAPNVETEQVAPGVWLLAGQSHHSALIELSDRMLLVEAPQSEARTLAVIARARELQPNKPLADLIMTHHHFDHTAGLRAAISEGLRVVTLEGNRDFVERMTGRPHTVVADALAKNPKPLVVETIGDDQVVKDSLRTVAIYHVRDNPHSETMLMVHLPAERVIIEVDAYSPGGSVNPYAANLLENITRRGLRVDRIVPLHGSIAPFSDLTKIGAQQTN